jgi:hypothetical protein
VILEDPPLITPVPGGHNKGNPRQDFSCLIYSIRHFVVFFCQRSIPLVVPDASNNETEANNIAKHKKNKWFHICLRLHRLKGELVRAHPHKNIYKEITPRGHL